MTHTRIFRLKKGIISVYKSRNKLKIAIFFKISNLYSHSQIVYAIILMYLHYHYLTMPDFL